jgi:osmotically-inducible protein OsmY
VIPAILYYWELLGDVGNGRKHKETNEMEARLSPSIDDVVEIAQGRLRNSPYMAIRTVSCDFENGVLLLRGRLRSFHYKQLAQEAVRRLAGVEQIVNAIEVIDRGPFPDVSNNLTKEAIP